MKFTLTNRRKWLIGAGAALLLTATPSFALFGIGDIVFDPTSYASLVSQLTTLQTQYTMLKNNITHFSLQAAVADDAACSRKRERPQYVRGDGGHEHCAQYQLAVCIEYRMESRHGHDERQCAVLPCQPVPRQLPHVAACLD